MVSSTFGFGEYSQVLQIERVGALNGQAEGTAPNLSGGDTKGARNTEGHCVIVVLSEAVVRQEGT